MSENTWEKVQTKGNFPILYGHSSVVYDVSFDWLHAKNFHTNSIDSWIKNKIFVYGGVHDGRHGTRYVSNAVWSLDLITRHWLEVRFSREAGQCRRSICGTCVFLFSSRKTGNSYTLSNVQVHLSWLAIQRPLYMTREIELDTARVKWSYCSATPHITAM